MRREIAAAAYGRLAMTTFDRRPRTPAHEIRITWRRRRFCAVMKVTA